MEEYYDKLSQLETFLLKYPGLVMTQSKCNGTSFRGPIRVKNIWCNLKISCPNFPNMNNFQLQLQYGFNIKTYTQAKLNIPYNWSIGELLENLHSLVEFSNAVVSNFNDDLQTNIYAEIVNLYAPTEYDILLNDNCSLIRFTKFPQNEQHFLEVALPTLQIREHSLPLCIDWQEIFCKINSLTMILQRFKSLLEDLKPFYENFADIDELCHVVEPPLPNYKANWRLFVLRDRVFLKVQFSDPFSPLNSMSIQIIGPTAEVTELRRIYSEGINDWDAELNVHKNLLRIFDLCFFPMAPSEGSQNSLQYCNICYCYRLDHGEIPIISCDNNYCNLIFHTFCLKEWFNTLADGKTFLNVAFGTCPFCKSKLSTSFQELLE